MIASLRGTVQLREPGRVVLEIGGVGYEVFVPLATYHRLPQPGEAARLEVRQVVREDSITLYGFASASEKQAFELLMQVQQVGPKLALAILSALSADELIGAIQREDVQLLDAVPGVGAKVAERIVRELRDKTEAIILTATKVPSANGGSGLSEDAISALVNLGYKPIEARRAVEKAAPGAIAEGADLEAVIRKSLALLLGEKH
jgi:Holliday junction DNA helicase RuvA